MPLWTRVKSIWRKQLIERFEHVDHTNNNARQPKLGKQAIDFLSINTSHILTSSNNIQPIMSHFVTSPAHLHKRSLLNHRLKYIFSSLHLPSSPISTATLPFRGRDFLAQHWLSYLQKPLSMNRITLHRSRISNTVTAKFRGRIPASRG